MKSRLLGAVSTFAITIVLSTSANAAVVSADWQSVGDNLVTRDTASGLDWLDLTITDGMSYDQVISKLLPGGQFDGFRLATSAEVITLWRNFGIDLSQSALWQTSGYNPLLDVAVTFLGSTYNTDPITYPYGGADGITSDVPPFGLLLHDVLGATYYSGFTYYYRDNNVARTDSGGYINSGAYLVQAVSVPAAVWLFGSGLFGLVGVAKRKKT